MIVSLTNLTPRSGVQVERRWGCISEQHYECCRQMSVDNISSGPFKCPASSVNSQAPRDFQRQQLTAVNRPCTAQMRSDVVWKNTHPLSVYARAQAPRSHSQSAPNQAVPPATAEQHLTYRLRNFRRPTPSTRPSLSTATSIQIYLTPSRPPNQSARSRHRYDPVISILSDDLIKFACLACFDE